ncbi:hypothetical protein HC891_15520 [Candidatus Gracilibacteria bacterium]|nr:hypothetical protein [Candidatus Gracilibacteria bacterium]
MPDWPFRVPEPPDGFEHQALAAHTTVDYERGQWVVYLEVTFWDEIRRHRIAAYPSERLALIAADWIKRGAQRDLPGPPTGIGRMQRLGLRPQPLGIFPLPASYLVLPPTADAEATLAALMRGTVPAELPTIWRFYALAFAGDSAAALAALQGDHSLEAHYNRFVLSGDPADYALLTERAEGDLALLGAIAAYTLGLLDAPPAADIADSELAAFALMTQAAFAIEQQRIDDAEAILAEAATHARPASPLLAAQLLVTRADLRSEQRGAR